MNDKLQDRVSVLGSRSSVSNHSEGANELETGTGCNEASLVATISAPHEKKCGCLLLVSAILYDVSTVLLSLVWLHGYIV